MYNLSFYVPILHCDEVKDAIFETGAGQVGDYKNCSWQTLGEGQFKPTSGSQPFRGYEGSVETTGEYRVEMVCSDSFIKSAIAALRNSHPYEQPAYTVTRMEEF
jgi:hypothetical protein